MPDSNHAIYPAPKMKEVTDIEGLQQLDRAINRAKSELAHYKQLSTLGTLKITHLGYTVQDIKDGITHWQTTLDNMVRCWNHKLTKMKL